MNEITWTLNLQVKEGPKFPFNDTLKVEAYDKVMVDVPGKTEAGPGQAKINVQSGDLDDIELILITCGDRAKDAKRLSYTINDDNAEVELSKLHLTMGKGAYGLLKNSPKWLTFKNEDAAVATVTVLVARKAVDSPPAPVETPTSPDTTRSKKGDTGTSSGTNTGSEELQV